MTVGFGDAKNTDWQCSVGWIRDVHFVLNSIIFYKGWHPQLIAAFPHEGIICTSQFPGHVYSVPHVQASSIMWKYCKLDQYKKKQGGERKNNIWERQKVQVVWRKCVTISRENELNWKFPPVYWVWISALRWLSLEKDPEWQRCDDWHNDEMKKKRGKEEKKVM